MAATTMVLMEVAVVKNLNVGLPIEVYADGLAARANEFFVKIIHIGLELLPRLPAMILA